MTAVHVHGIVVDGGVAAAGGSGGPVGDARDPARRDVHVRAARGAVADAGIGHGDDLAAAVIAA